MDTDKDEINENSFQFSFNCHESPSCDSDSSSIYSNKSSFAEPNTPKSYLTLQHLSYFRNQNSNDNLLQKEFIGKDAQQTAISQQQQQGSFINSSNHVNSFEQLTFTNSNDGFKRHKFAKSNSRITNQYKIKLTPEISKIRYF